jgi:hypothetical protein
MKESVHQGHWDLREGTDFPRLGLSRSIRQALAQIVDYIRSTIEFDEARQRSGGENEAFQPHPPLLIICEMTTALDEIIRVIRKFCRRRKPLIRFPSGHLYDSETVPPPPHSIADAAGDLGTLSLGYFKAAYEGILFFPELASLTPENQRILNGALRSSLLQTWDASRKLFWPPDVIVVAATQPGVLPEMVAQGLFLPDLYRRFVVFRPVVIPPLRDRSEDAPLVIESLLYEHGRRWGLSGLSLWENFTNEAAELLVGYPWSDTDADLECVITSLLVNNFREKPSYEATVDDVEQALALGEQEYDGAATEKTVEEEQVKDWSFAVNFPKSQPLKEVLDEVKRALMKEALSRSGGNKSQAARLLGIPRRDFY